jgi:hypothetical protein
LQWDVRGNISTGVADSTRKGVPEYFFVGGEHSKPASLIKEPVGLQLTYTIRPILSLAQNTAPRTTIIIIWAVMMMLVSARRTFGEAMQ